MRRVARWVGVAAVAVLALGAGRAEAAGTAGKEYNISCDTGTTGNVSLYTVTRGNTAANDFKVRCTFLDQTGALLTLGSNPTINGIVNTRTGTALVSGTDFSAATVANPSAGVYDLTFRILSTGLTAAGDILRIEIRATNATTTDGQRLSAYQYVKCDNAAVAGDVRHVVAQPSTNGDIVVTANAAYAVDLRVFDAFGSSLNVGGTLTATLTRWRNNGGTTITGQTPTAAWNAGSLWYDFSFLNPTTALTAADREYIIFQFTSSVMGANYLFSSSMGLTARAAPLTGSALVVPFFTDPWQFVPAQPAAPTTASPTTNSLVVNWTATVGAKTFTLDRATDAAFTQNLVSTPGLTGTTTTATGLNSNTTYYFRIRAVNPIGNSANSGTGTGTTLSAAVNTTAAGTVTASSTVGACDSITVSAPYTDDSNGNNTLSYRYRTPTGTGAWSAATPVSHSASPYAFNITGLTTGATYDVEVTYVDADGVTGTAIQTVSNITVGPNCTVPGTMTASASGCSAIAVSAPYTVDGNGNNTLSYRTRTPAGTGAWTGATPVSHSASPYSFSITGLTTGASYDVEVTYVDADGISGTAVQTQSAIAVGANCTVTGAVTMDGSTCGQATVSAAFSVNGDGDGTTLIERGSTSTGPWGATNPACAAVAGASPRQCVDTVAAGTYWYRATFTDPDGVTGTNPVVSASSVTVTVCAIPSTAAGTVTAVQTTGATPSIAVSAPYTNDSNGSNSLSYRYQVSGSGSWTSGTRTHAASPYAFTLAGLTCGSSYDVEVTYVDGDGVTGTNPQTVSGITLNNCVALGTPSATQTTGATPSLSVSASFTGDSNSNASATYATSSNGGSTWSGETPMARGAGAFTATAASLTCGTTYLVRVTASDVDSVTGSPATSSSVTMTNCTSAGAVSMSAAVCGQASVSATFAQDANSNGSTSFERGTTITGPWVAASCSSASGASPRQCADVTAAGTYWYRATFADADGVNGSPVVSGASVTVVACPPFQTSGSTYAGSEKPVVAIINPMDGAVLSLPAKVQVRVFSPNSRPISSVILSVNSVDKTPTKNTTGYTATTTATSGVWEYTITSADGVPTGTYFLLQARAQNDYALPAAGPVYSGRVNVKVLASPAKGDGNLLVRDNSSQLCADCHTGLQTHSSEATGSKYGSWSSTCRECHTPHSTTNLKLIGKQIKPPELTGATAAQNVTFYNRTGWAAGSYAQPGTGAGATGVCEVCHTRTDYYRADGTKTNETHATGPCGDCHRHDKGLAASCTGCHGDDTNTRVTVSGADARVNAAPPRVSTNPPTGFYVSSGGVHLPHVNEANFRTNPLACSECHAIPNAHQGTTDVQWGALATGGGKIAAVNMVPLAGTLNAANWSTPTCSNWCHGDGLKGGGRGLTWNWNVAQATACNSCHGQTSAAMPAVAAANHPQNAACANCHGTGYDTTGLTGTAKDTHVDGTIQKPSGCTACHGVLAGISGAAVASGSPLAAPGYNASAVDTKGNTARSFYGVGAHIKHVNTGLMSGKCAECHVVPADGNTAHADAAFDWNWAAIQGVTPTYTAPNCTNYCHSNARPLGQASATTASVSWNSTTAMTCNDCHIGTAFGGSGLSTRHQRHVQGAAGTYAYDCSQCHQATMQTDSSTVIGFPANHVDGTKEVAFSTLKFTAIDQSGGSYAGYGCSATYCHSNGTSTSAPFGAPVGAALLWNAGGTSADCSNCHGGNASAAVVIGTSAHGAHVNNSGVIGANVACFTCHALTINSAASDRIINSTTGYAQHVDGTKDVTATSWNTTTKGCSANYCHSNGRDPAATDATRYAAVVWNTGTTLGCNGCHGRGTAASGAPDYADGATLAEANSHWKHTSNGTDRTTCQKCHYGYVDPTGTQLLTASHTDGSRDVAIAPAYDTNGASANYNATTKTCNSVSCHGTSTPVWGTTLGCNTCHGNVSNGPRVAVNGADANLNAVPPVGLAGETLSSQKAVGAHIPHANQLTLADTAIACAVCHNGATHNDVKQVAWSGLATWDGKVPTWNTTTQTCSNTYCHSPNGTGGTGATEMGGSIRTPTWNATNQAVCGTCHGAPPPVDASAAADHPQNTNCNACHTNYATTGVTGSAKTTHMNGWINAGSDKPNNGCTACHGTLAGMTGAAVLSSGASFWNAAPGYAAVGVDTSGAVATTVASVGVHDAHVRPSAHLNAATPFDCSVCHGSRPGDGDTLHADAVVGIGWTAPANGGASVPTPTAFNTAWETTPNCTNYCHSNAAPVGGAEQRPSFTWVNATTLTCTSCHSNTASANNRGLSARHNIHIDVYSNYTCDECHSTVVADNSRTTIVNGANHVRGSHTISFSATALNAGINESGGSYAQGPSYTCSNLYCHSGGVRTSAPFNATATAAAGTPVWNTAAWNATPNARSCRWCHGGDATATPTIGVATGSNFAGSTTHQGHVDNATLIGTNYGCVVCHNTVVSGNTTVSDVTLHVNGRKDVSLNARGGKTSGAYNTTAQTCSTSYCHSTGQAPNPQYVSAQWNAALTLGCNGCHGVGSANGEPNYTNTGAGTLNANSHPKHVGDPADCNLCHVNTADPAGNKIVASATIHTDGAIQVAMNTAAVGATAAFNGTDHTCSNVDCHGGSGSKSPAWGTTGTLTCSTCHLQVGSDVDNWNFSDKTVSKISSAEWNVYGHGQTTTSFYNGTRPFNTAGVNNRCVYCHDDQNSAHGASGNPFRLRGAAINTSGYTTAYSSADERTIIANCLNCHDLNGTVAYGVDPDALGSGQPQIGPAASRINSTHHGAKHAKYNVNGGQRCWDCHDPHGDGNNLAMIGRDVMWNATDVHGFAGTRAAKNAVFNVAYSYINAVAISTGQNVCQVCHTNTAFWRNDGTTGITHNPTAACMSCHKHQKPPDLAFWADPDCTGCHNAAVSGPNYAPGRDNIVSEFKNPWSHKSGTNRTTPSAIQVSKWDCIVCHMEGSPTDASLTGQHGDGLIDLRDPDTGNAIRKVAFVNGSAGYYNTDAGPITFNAFSRNLNSAAIEDAAAAIMMNQCLKCHDANGAAAFNGNGVLSAMNTINGARSAVSPFATNTYRISGQYNVAGYTALNVVGGVTNVYDSFVTTNSSYHPVLGRNNNWYARANRMFPPWNVAKLNATPPAKLNDWGLLMSCWDCHAENGVSGTRTRTVTAHGGAVTLRGLPGTVGTTLNATYKTTLCLTCHALYESCGLVADCTATPTHGGGSALGSDLKENVKTPYLQYGCNLCHSSGYRTATKAVRPVRAIDAHGMNKMPPYNAVPFIAPWNAAWRPRAFVRATDTLGMSQPRVFDSTTNTNGSCRMSGAAAGGPNCSRSSTETYTPGGYY